jgi:methyl-accepting chemotaxis protein
VAKGRPIVVEWAANVRDWLKSTRQVEKSVEDVADELKDATKESGRFEDRFTDDMRQAERAADKAADNMGRDFKRASSDASGAFEGLPGNLGQLGSEAGSEMTQNIGEAISSGSANIQDIVTGIGGGLVSGLTGPVGYAAAGAIGLAGLAFANAKQKADELMALAQSTADAIAGMYEYGLQQATKTEELAAFNDWLNENMDSLSEMEGDLEAAGVSFEEYAAALWAGGEPLDNLKAKLDAVKDSDYVVTETGRDAGRRVYGERADAVDRIKDNMDAVRDVTGEVEGEQKKVNDAVNLMADYLGVSKDEATEYDEAMGNAIDPTREVADETERIADNLAGIQGKTFTATLVIKPGDAYTSAALDLTGP